MRVLERMKRKHLSLLALVCCLTLASCGEYSVLQKSPDYDYKYEAAKAYYNVRF